MKIVKSLSLLALGTAAAIATPTLAQTPIIAAPSGTPVTLTNGPYTLGFSFSTSQTFTVTGLGVFDDANDGLIEAHQVGLWNDAQVLLATTTVGAGTSGTLIGGFRFASVTPFMLGAGSYRVGALFSATPADTIHFPGSSSIGLVLPGVTYGSSAFGSNTAALTFPGNLNGTGGYIGANVLVASVPEASTWALMIVGFGAMGAGLRRRRVRTRVAFG